MPSPNLDTMANAGITFFSFYAQPSYTPGRAAMQTGRYPQPQRHDHGGHPGPGRRAAGGRMDACLRAEAVWPQDVVHRQVAPGRIRLCPAQRPGLRRMRRRFGSCQWSRNTSPATIAAGFRHVSPANALGAHTRWANAIAPMPSGWPMPLAGPSAPALPAPGSLIDQSRSKGEGATGRRRASVSEGSSPNRRR